jgi:pyruvate dehydrogenase E1 component alpha subunit
MKPDQSTVLEMLRTMTRIRQFEQRLAKFHDYRGYFEKTISRNEGERTEALLTSTLYDFASTGMIGGAVHLYVGQEAVATGVCAHLRDSDYVTGSHRGHGHFLAKGGSARSALAELMGKATGASRGCGGSMHLYDAQRGFLGGNGIIGAQIPLALGPAFAAKYRGEDGVSVAFFGDGAANQGTLYESMNIAATWKLPVLFVCENNLYAATTPARITLPTEDIAPRAAAFGMPAEIVDGQDVLAVYEIAGEAVARAREGEGPSFIEAKTYRYQGHCGAEAEHAFPDECAAWRERDPIELLRTRMLEEGLATEGELDQVSDGVQAELDEAERFAVSSPLPEAEWVEQFVF